MTKIIIIIIKRYENIIYGKKLALKNTKIK